MLYPALQHFIKFAASAAKAGSEGWAVYKALWLQALYRLNLAAATPAAFTPLDAAESQAFSTLHQAHRPEKWTELWEKSEALLAQVSGLTLDKQQVLLSLLHATQEKT